MVIKGGIGMRTNFNEKKVMRFTNIFGGIINILLFLVAISMKSYLLAFIAFLGIGVQVMQYKNGKMLKGTN